MRLRLRTPHVAARNLPSRGRKWGVRDGNSDSSATNAATWHDRRFGSNDSAVSFPRRFGASAPSAPAEQTAEAGDGARSDQGWRRRADGVVAKRAQSVFAMTQPRADQPCSALASGPWCEGDFATAIAPAPRRWRAGTAILRVADQPLEGASSSRWRWQINIREFARLRRCRSGARANRRHFALSVLDGPRSTSPVSGFRSHKGRQASPKRHRPPHDQTASSPITTTAFNAVS
jgi:hypothetical protein